MRFLVDMPLSVETADFLRARGHDVIHLREQGLQRLPDAGVFHKARRERRILITMDLGFGHILAFARARFPSVILFRVENNTPQHLHDLLEKRLPSVEKELKSGAVVVIEENRIRIHKLPV